MQDMIEIIKTDASYEVTVDGGKPTACKDSAAVLDMLKRELVDGDGDESFDKSFQRYADAKDNDSDEMTE